MTEQPTTDPPDGSLMLVVYGESGTGKSPIGQTTPVPRLVLDCENGSRFVKGRKVYWEPTQGGPPAADGTWDTCIVPTRDFATFLQALAWLKSGQHPFVSVTIDSLSELQKRCKDQLVAADEKMEQQTWGRLLDQMERSVREIRDLTFHPTNPLRCVCILALVDEIKGRFRPMLQGRLAITLPGLVDVIGYLYTQGGSAGELGAAQRVMLVQPDGAYVAKDRTAELPSGGIVGRFGARVSGPINVQHIMTEIHKEDS